MPEMKDTPDRIISRLDITEEMISKLKIIMEAVQNEMQGRKSLTKFNR